VAALRDGGSISSFGCAQLIRFNPSVRLALLVFGSVVLFGCAHASRFDLSMRLRSIHPFRSSRSAALT